MPYWLSLAVVKTVITSFTATLVQVIFTSGEVGVGERTGEALGDIWCARGAVPLDFEAWTGGFLWGDWRFTLLLGLIPPFMAGGGVLGLGGRPWGATGDFDLGNKLAEESLLGRIVGGPPFLCRLASRVSIFIDVVGGGGGKAGLGARDWVRWVGGEDLRFGEGDLDCLSWKMQDEIYSQIHILSYTLYCTVNTIDTWHGGSPPCSKLFLWTKHF